MQEIASAPQEEKRRRVEEAQGHIGVDRLSLRCDGHPTRVCTRRDSVQDIVVERFDCLGVEKQMFSFSVFGFLFTRSILTVPVNLTARGSHPVLPGRPTETDIERHERPAFTLKNPLPGPTFRHGVWSVGE